MSLPLDRDGDLSRHVYDSLEDEEAQPLEHLETEAPPGFDHFSELETSLSEWSFGYGVAWAIARMREPFASSRRVSELAEQAIANAWRSFGDQPWRSLMDQGHAERAFGSVSQPPVPTEAQAEEQTPPSQLDDFMGNLARARPSRRPRDRGGPQGGPPADQS